MKRAKVSQLLIHTHNPSLTRTAARESEAGVVDDSRIVVPRYHRANVEGMRAHGQGDPQRDVARVQVCADQSGSQQSDAPITNAGRHETDG